MKKLAKHIFCVLFTIFYIMGFVGFGVHKCRADGTTNLFLMMGDVSCESIHDHLHDHHDCCDSQCDDHPFHYTECSGDCCSTDVFAVTSEQERLQDEDSGWFNQHIAVPLLYYDLMTIAFTTVDFTSRFLTPPKVGVLLSAISVWRL